MRLLQQVADAAIQQRRFLRDVLFSVTEGRLCLRDEPADLPLELPAVGDSITLSPPTLNSLRRRVEEAAAINDLPEPLRQDFILAVGEAAMNAIRHGGGGKARVCADGHKTVQVWIQDQGKGIAMEHLPRATLDPGYSSAGTFGHGFWIMLKTCHRVYLLTGTTGTTVVLEQDKEEPPPPWLRAAEAIGMSLDEEPVL